MDLIHVYYEEVVDVSYYFVFSVFENGTNIIKDLKVIVKVEENDCYDEKVWIYSIQLIINGLNNVVNIYIIILIIYIHIKILDDEEDLLDIKLII